LTTDHQADPEPSGEPAPSLDLWRERSLSVVLGAGVAITAVILAYSVPHYLSEGRIRLAVGNLVVFACALALLLSRRRVSYGVRALLTSGFVYAAGLNVLTTTGFLSSGPVWLFTANVFAATFLGLRATTAAILVNSATIAVVGYLVQSGQLGSAIVPFGTDRQALITCVTFVLLNTLTGVALAGMIFRLESLAGRNREALEDLRQKQTRLIAAGEELQREVQVRAEAEQALRESESRYRLLVESTSDGFFIADASSGRFVFLNQRICELVGYGVDEGLHLALWDMVAEVDQGKVQERIQELREGRTPSSEQHVYTMRRKDGSTFRGEVSASLASHGAGLVVQGILRDVTLFERLREVQRFEAIGTLAGGLAHNFNNLLMGIQGDVSAMLMDIDPGHPHHEPLKSIEAQVGHGATITRQILGFARGGKFEVKVTDLNVVLRQCAEMFGRTRKEITIHLTCAADLLATEVDRGQIEQVLLNLFVNAHQAMPGGGEIRLRTENVTLDAQDVAPHGIAAGRYAKISVADTGAGMAESVQRRIFEPFFTTKEVGQGTGLGLASAYGIIQNHRGLITVQSKIGRGSTFELLLPASDAARPPEQPRAAEGEAVPGGAETILLVDDEDLVLKATRRLLSSLGYTVLSADSGEKALAIIAEQGGRIDLILADLIMPVMTGAALVDRLRAVAPQIRVLFYSGYGTEDQGSSIVTRGEADFIQKPFDRATLARKLREVLDR
jgi:PAS domain S-box-containing protein